MGYRGVPEPVTSTAQSDNMVRSGSRFQAKHLLPRAAQSWAVVGGWGALHSAHGFSHLCCLHVFLPSPSSTGKLGISPAAYHITCTWHTLLPQKQWCRRLLFLRMLWQAHLEGICLASHVTASEISSISHFLETPCTLIPYTCPFPVAVIFCPYVQKAPHASSLTGSQLHCKYSSKPVHA